MFFDTKKKKDNYRKILRTFVEKNFYIKDSFTDNDSFFEHGIIDSTGVLELVAFIEKTFEIEVDDEEVIPENLDCVDSLTNFIKTKFKKVKT